VPTAKLGKTIAPSLSDRLRSIIRSPSMSVTVPSPAQAGHMPDGSLNEYAGEYPADGSPRRENSIRSIVHTSVAVPTVDRELVPSGFWSTTTTVVSPLSELASGAGSCGSFVRTNAGIVE